MYRLQTKIHGDRYSNTVHGIQSNSFEEGKQEIVPAWKQWKSFPVSPMHILSLPPIRFPSVRNDAWLPIIGVCRRLEPVLDTLTGVQ